MKSSAQEDSPNTFESGTKRAFEYVLDEYPGGGLVRGQAEYQGCVRNEFFLCVHKLVLESFGVLLSATCTLSVNAHHSGEFRQVSTVLEELRES